jgi:shikimate dehydrogenase
MRLFGLIGFPLSHSFSGKYFEKKFAAEKITDAEYRLFPFENISDIRQFAEQQKELQGFNVTIPHKINILPYLDIISEEAASIGAVNCVKIDRNASGITLTGYNTDTYGFQEALIPQLQPFHKNALVLGTGGASKAVCYTLQTLGINYTLVSRSPNSENTLTYPQIDENILNHNLLIINTTPIGMYPDIENCPSIPYRFLTKKHLLYDLIYNPAETKFLQLGRERGVTTINGQKMLELQAEKSWEIWNV